MSLLTYRYTRSLCYRLRIIFPKGRRANISQYRLDIVTLNLEQFADKRDGDSLTVRARAFLVLYTSRLPAFI